MPSAPSAPLNRRTILLIEDDNDVREFLLSELESCFDLKVASDGKAGIAMQGVGCRLDSKRRDDAWNEWLRAY